MVVGLDVAEKIRASGVGRKMFLTTPFIDQALPTENCCPTLLSAALLLL